MRSPEKHVVIVRHPLGKGTATYPVSVHANAKTANLAKAQLAACVKAGDVAKVLALAPKFKLAEDGAVPADVKFAVVALPYEPSTPASEADGDTFEF